MDRSVSLTTSRVEMMIKLNKLRQEIIGLISSELALGHKYLDELNEIDHQIRNLIEEMAKETQQ